MRDNNHLSKSEAGNISLIIGIIVAASLALLVILKFFVASGKKSDDSSFKDDSENFHVVSIDKDDVDVIVDSKIGKDHYESDEDDE